MNADLDSNRKYIWECFSLSAGQRIETFRLYVSLSTAILAGIIWLLKENRPITGFPFLILGTLLISLSIIFHMLDRRIRTLVKNAEEALIFLEEKLPSEDNPLKIFVQGKKENGKTRSYGFCFSFLFILFSVIGFLIALHPLCRLITVLVSLSR